MKISIVFTLFIISSTAFAAGVVTGVPAKTLFKTLEAKPISAYGDGQLGSYSIYVNQVTCTQRQTVSPRFFCNLMAPDENLDLQPLTIVDGAARKLMKALSDTGVVDEDGSLGVYVMTAKTINCKVMGHEPRSLRYICELM